MFLISQGYIYLIHKTLEWKQCQYSPNVLLEAYGDLRIEDNVSIAYATTRMIVSY